MVYVRHRDRMVQESVAEDLVNTLIAFRWMSGTTTREVISPWDEPAGPQLVTTAPNQVMGVLNFPLTVDDYYSEVDDPEANVVGDAASGHTKPNTMALDDGQAGTPELVELGSKLMAVPYRFALAFFAESVGVAQAVLNDLRDRYQGKIVKAEYISLFDYNTDPDVEVGRLEVDDFQFLRSEDDVIEASELTLFYAQLTLTDYVD